MAVALGVNTPATRLFGFSPQTSCCASAGHRPTNQAQTFIRLTTQDVEPQPRASSRETSSLARMSVSRPP